MPKGANINGYELTKVGMKALFNQMGYPDAATGEIVDKNVTFEADKLESQGFMPLLTNTGSSKDSGHWMMLVKGPDNKYFLYDPLGQASGTSFKKSLLAKLPPDATLDVIPVEPGLHKGMTGYWVASAGVKAHKDMNGMPAPTLETLGANLSTQMKTETAGWNLQNLKNFLAAIADGFKTDPRTTPVNASVLRESIERFEVAKAKKPTTAREWDNFSLFTDQTVKAAAQWAYDKHLGTPYTGRVESTPARLDGGITVNRQVHGLAHTLRTMAYSQVIIEEARKAKLRGEKLPEFQDGKTLADVTPQDLKKIMIAQAFFVAGREDEASDSENYKKYHLKSRVAFLEYVDAHPELIPDVFKDKADVDFYADVIEDKNHEWDKSAAHVLVNQSHMVDLVRVKQPPESYMEFYFRILSHRIGPKAAEAVFAQQRKMFSETFELVTQFDSNNHEPHLVDGGKGRYLIRDGQPVREPRRSRQTVGDLTLVTDKYVPKENERIMKVSEYLALPEVAARFPGSGKKLDDGYGGLKEFQIMQRVSSRERGLCETNVDYCLKQLEKAYTGAQSAPLKTPEANPAKSRRGPNPDEVAAAKIIKQILADPENIKDDHVMLNGQRLDEQFFRDLLKKCDMGVVGSLLNATDMSNINKLMAHEKETPFREPGDGVVSVEKIGKEWQDNYMPNNGRNVQRALVHMMQDGSWYYRRLNAVAQGRDSGSTFKEVMLTALLIPSTRKALVDSQPARQVEPPKSVFRGMMDMPESFKRSLMEQSEAIIANSGVGLFTDPSAQMYQQMQVNHFTHVFGKTCLSTAANEAGASAFGSEAPGHNIMVQIDDPDGVLDAQRVSSMHDPNGENEYSVYLPDDVALIPMQIINRKPPEADLLRLVAVKSPDFAARHQSGFASEPFLKMQEPKVETALQAIEQTRMKFSQEIDKVKAELTIQKDKPIRGFWSRLGHYAWGTADGQISQARKDYYSATLIPLLGRAQDAIASDNPDKIEHMKRVLSEFPSDKQLAAFGSDEGKRMKDSLVALKQNLQKQIIEQEAAVELRQCKDAIGRKDWQGMVDALPEHGKWSQSSRAQSIAEVRTELVDLHKATPPKMSEEQRAKLQKRFDEQSPIMSKRIESSLDALEKMKGRDNDSIEAFLNKARVVQKEIELLKNEKIRCSADPSTVDLSAITALETRLNKAAIARCSDLTTQAGRQLDAISTITEYEQAEPILAKRVELIGGLERLMGTTGPEVTREKPRIVDLKSDYAKLQQAYPQAVELDFKAEQLVSRMRAQCNEHLAGLTPPNRGNDAYYINTIWASVFGESDDYLSQKAKYN